jgi:hypothetical protein
MWMQRHVRLSATGRGGNLYDKKCNALDIQRGKKSIFLQENDAEGTLVAEELFFS